MSDSEEENITLNVEETEAAKKAADEAAEAKRIADEEAAKKAADEEAAKKAADEEAKRIADEEAAKKAADEEAKRIADEEAVKKAADEEAKRIADEESKKSAEADLADQLLEVSKLNAITNKLWKEGQKTNFESMSHTEAGVLKYEIKKRSEVHQGFMTSLTRNSNKIIRQNAPTVQQKPVAKLSTRQAMFNSGMMFGRR